MSPSPPTPAILGALGTPTLPFPDIQASYSRTWRFQETFVLVALEATTLGRTGSVSREWFLRHTWSTDSWEGSVCWLRSSFGERTCPVCPVHHHHPPPPPQVQGQGQGQPNSRKRLRHCVPLATVFSRPSPCKESSSKGHCPDFYCVFQALTTLCPLHRPWGNGPLTGPSLQRIKNPLNDPNLKPPRLSVSVA